MAHQCRLRFEEFFCRPKDFYVRRAYQRQLIRSTRNDSRYQSNSGGVAYSLGAIQLRSHLGNDLLQSRRVDVDAHARTLSRPKRSGKADVLA